MLPQEIIRRKREKTRLGSAEIGALRAGPRRRLVFGRPGSRARHGDLSQRHGPRGGCCADAGDARFRHGARLVGPAGAVADKHSTGGVGDNVSLMLAPIVAACGVYVPMISGRGLGHTGGTLDKMDAIPGYSSQPDRAAFEAAVRACGCAIIGQTGDLAPADGRLYAIRDVTATVESIPLITASILSKKLAAGLQSLVLDVKTGSGAFMAKSRDATALARSLVEVAEGAGLPTAALITDMNEPLASAAGNAVEVVNAVDFLTGRHRDPRLFDVTMALAGEMLISSGRAGSHREAAEIALAALDSGQAAEMFGRMVSQLGGPADFIERMEAHLPQAPVTLAVVAEEAGFVEAVATRDIGLAVVELAAGAGARRTRSTRRWADPAGAYLGAD